MPELLTYTAGELPPHIKCQITCFLRVQWPWIFEDNPFWDYFEGKDAHRASVVLVEKDVVISHAEVNYRELDHKGASYKVYGVSAVFTYPAFRKLGYGRELMAGVTAHIDATDADVAMLFCLPERMNFYAASGWEWIDTSIHYGRKDDPQTDEIGRLMMRFVSPEGQAARLDFEQAPVYVGGFTW